MVLTPPSLGPKQRRAPLLGAGEAEGLLQPDVFQDRLGPVLLPCRLASLCPRETGCPRGLHWLAFSDLTLVYGCAGWAPWPFLIFCLDKIDVLLRGAS